MVEAVFTGFGGFAGVRNPPPPTSPPEVVDVPYVGGLGMVGELLTCTMGNWNGEPTGYGYQWMANEITVSTDGDTYVISDGDAGKTVTCIVTATNAAGSTQAPPSNEIAVEGPARSSSRRGGKE